MEDLFKSILAIQSILLAEGVPSIVIGGVAVAAWGEPRLTRDVDLKIMLGRDEAYRLVDFLPQEYQYLIPNPLDSLRRQAMVFIQDSLGTRLDLLLADTPYDKQAIQRGRTVEIQPGLKIILCTPEDLIIYKLISTRLRDHEDVRSVVRRQGNLLDDDYIIDWLSQFEQALDDSTLISEYRSLRSRLG